MIFLQERVILHSIRGSKYPPTEMSSYQPVPFAKGDDDGRNFEHGKHERLRIPPSRQSFSSLALPASIVLLCMSLMNLFVAKRFYRPTNEICTAQTSM